MNFFIMVYLFLPTVIFAGNFPTVWFKEIPRSEASSWEILPQDALPGEVILSKRTELGIFSNFASTPILLEGKNFASIEGLWQSLKYPDPEILTDLRHGIPFPHTRSEVEKMISFTAKTAGNQANKIYRENQLQNVNWGEHFFDYTDGKEGSAFHYILIKRALRAKLDQTPGLWNLLLQTECLILRPDHKISPTDPPSFHYDKIFMELREEKNPCEKIPDIFAYLRE